MKNLRDIIVESRAHDLIHTNPSMEAVKNLAKTSAYKSLRYVINRTGKLTVGDAGQYTHPQLDNNSYEWEHTGKIHYNEPTDSYHAIDSGHWGKFDGSRHPYYAKMEKAGIKLGE